MTLSQRTILIIVSTFIALLLILAVTSDIILLKSFSKLERTVLAGDVRKVRKEIDEVYVDLVSSSIDMGAIVEKNGVSYIKELQMQSLFNQHIDVVVCFSSSGKVLSAQSVDFHIQQPNVLTKGYFAQMARALSLMTSTTSGGVKGLIEIDGKPLQLVLRPLSADVIILVGRYLDSVEVARISALTAFSIELVPVIQRENRPDIADALSAFEHGVPNPFQVIDKGQIAGYSLVKDLFGQPVLVARIVEQRLLYEQGKAAITYVVLSLFLAGGVFCCLMLFFIKGSILKRIEILGLTVKKISSQRSMSSRLPVAKENDELNDLALAINNMMDSLESAENATRDSEERYRVLFERAPDSIFIIGMDGNEAGKIISANRSAAEQHGYTIEELCNMSIFDINSEADSNKVTDLIDRISRGEWVTKEVWHKKKDASRFPMEVHAGMVVIKGRSYVLAFDRDITSRKLAAESGRMSNEHIRKLNYELNRRASDLAAANSELEAFNYSVSHDMRGPLTRISGYCQILLEDDIDLDSQTKIFINRIYESGVWLNDMIDAMLHLSLLTRTEFVSDIVDLSLIAKTVIAELKRTEPDRVVSTDIQRDILAQGDHNLLKILMNNLLGNAWKYTSQTREAHIAFGQLLNESGMVYFIRDNGAGFDMEYVDKLFRVFSRLHDSSQFSGSGIGLATVQRIVARHGGRIWAEAETNHGATFFFTLKPDSSSYGAGISSVTPVLDGSNLAVL